MNDEQQEEITSTNKKKTGIVKPTTKINPTKSEMNVPDYAIERLARCMLPLIQKYYESKEGQQELKHWQNSR